MPIYNGERYIEQSVGSLLAQTFSDLEIIAVNDGSTDTTLEKLERLARADGRLVVTSRPNSGRPSFPKNDGLERARGAYIGFLDHDDYSHPDHVHALVDGLESHLEWIAAFHDVELVDAAGRAQPETYLKRARFLELAKDYLHPLADNWFDCGPAFYEFMTLRMGAIHTQSVLIARERLGNFKIAFDTRFKICEDTDLWMRLALKGRIGYLDRSLGYYRLHETNITGDTIDFGEHQVLLHVHNYDRAKAYLSPAALAAYRKKIASYYSSLAYAFYSELRLNEARKHYAQALEWSPASEYRWGLAKSYLPLSLLKLKNAVMQR
jgi:glycosyltransferase involved in cell wall biosynthesis